MPMATNPDIRGTGPSILIGAWGVNLSLTSQKSEHRHSRDRNFTAAYPSQESLIVDFSPTTISRFLTANEELSEQ